MTEARPWDGRAYADASGHHRAFDDWFLRRHSPGPSDTIVDVGAGSGQFTARLRECAPRGHVIGVEPDGAMLAVAQVSAGPRTHFLQGRAQELDGIGLPVPVDYVVSRAVFHWIALEDYPRCYDAVYAILRPGGWFHAESAGPGNVARLYGVIDRIAAEHGFAPAALTLPAPDTVAEWLAASGFDLPDGAVSLVPQVRMFSRDTLIDLLRTQVLLAYSLTIADRKVLFEEAVRRLDELRAPDGSFAQTFQRLEVLVTKPA